MKKPDRSTFSAEQLALAEETDTLLDDAMSLMTRALAAQQHGDPEADELRELGNAKLVVAKDLEAELEQSFVDSIKWSNRLLAEFAAHPECKIPNWSPACLHE